MSHVVYIYIYIYIYICLVGLLPDNRRPQHLLIIMMIIPSISINTIIMIVIRMYVYIYLSLYIYIYTYMLYHYVMIHIVAQDCYVCIYIALSC